MRTRITVAVVAMALSWTACHNKAAVQTTGMETTSKSEKAIVITQDNALAGAGDAIVIDSLSLQADVLSIFVNYSGGCKEHSFQLYFNGMYSKSLPPQANFVLKHEANGDACRQLILKELKFNIADAKFKGSNSMLIKIADKSLLYKY